MESGEEHKKFPWRWPWDIRVWGLCGAKKRWLCHLPVCHCLPKAACSLSQGMACPCIFSVSHCRTGIVCPVSNPSCSSPVCTEQWQSFQLSSQAGQNSQTTDLSSSCLIIWSTGHSSCRQGWVYLWFFLTAVLDADTKVGFAAHQEWLKAVFIPEDQRL